MNKVCLPNKWKQELLQKELFTELIIQYNVFTLLTVKSYKAILK